MKMLVTGANGMVGSYISAVFDAGDIVLTDLPELDITSKESVDSFISRFKPEYVIHLASATDVDRCETDPAFATKVNVDGTRNVALSCARHGCGMVYVSTGYVFDGVGRHEHVESDIPKPVNVYGRTKLEGELIVAQLLKKYYIFRAEWMIGGGPEKDKKFVGHIMHKCLKGEDIKAVDDMFSTPTFAGDFVKALKTLVEKVPYGLYHLSNKGVCSRYELALEVVKDLSSSSKVIPVSSALFPSPVPRAQSTAIKSEKLVKLGYDIMPFWKDSLREYMREWK